MAMNSIEALVASSLMQKKLSQDLKNLIGSFLKDPELRNLHHTAHFLRFTCENDITKRRDAKKVREELLPHVFHADPVAIDLFFTKPNTNPALLLTMTYFNEGYQSQKLNKFFCLREWHSVSPIQAAACSGDEFLLIELLARIVGVDQYRLEAQTQLKAVERRISDQTIIMNAIDAIIAMQSKDRATKEEAKLTLEVAQQSEEFQWQMKAFLNEMEYLRRQMTDQIKVQKTREISLDTTSELKSQEEEKSPSENIQIKYAEELEFLAPVLRLLKAYINFIIQYPKLVQKKVNGLGEIQKNLKLVGECHKRLPHYFKQEIFAAKPFSLNPLPLFATPPSRKQCRYGNNKPLNLDDLGFGADFLCKGNYAEAHLAVEVSGVGSFVIDLGSIAHLYKRRLTGLRKIIAHLENVDMACSFVKAAHDSFKETEIYIDGSDFIQMDF